MDDHFATFDQALAAEGKSDLTVKHYLGDLQQFATWFEQTNGEAFSPQAITSLDVVGYRSYLMTIKQYQPATTNRKLASLSRFCRWAKAEGLIEDNPAAEIKGVRQEQPTAPKSLSRQEWLRFLRTVHRGGNKRDIALVELLGNTGLRAGEVTALKLSDVEISSRKGEVTVRQGKGMKYRTVPLNADARKAISDYLEVRPRVEDEHIFIGQRGNALTRNGIWRIVKKYGQQAGLDLSPHTLRHTYGSRLLREEGVDLVTVQSTMGHESPATTAKYTRPSTEEQAAALEKLAVRESA
jgi:integrase/recombinase XerC